MRRYEGMFLFDNGVVHDWAGMEGEVRRLCDRIGANLLVCLKFDERKLAYEIRGRKRGTFVLAYFEAPTNKIGDMERDARLSESLLRALVVRAENLTEARLAELKAHPVDQPLQPMGSGRDDRDRGDFRDRDRGDRGDRGDFRDRDREPRREGFGGPEEAEGAPMAEADR